MALTTSNEASEEITLTNVHSVVYRRIRKSFLLSFAMFGALLIVLGATLDATTEHAMLAGIFGAAGIVIFVINIVFYLGYKFLEYRY